LPKVSIIILNWNGGKCLKECLNSVLRTKYPNFEVIVVDNASSDGSQEIVKRDYPQVTLIENKENLGFCIGNNIGIEKAKGDIMVLLNNDTIVDENWVKEIVKKAKDPNVGIIGCRIYYPNSRVIQSFGFRMKFLGYWENIGAGQEDYGQFNGIEEVDYVTGAALAIKREVIEKIGKLDPNFYAYGEDIDICLRAKKVGYKVVTSNAIVYHYGSASWKHFPIKKAYLNSINILYLIMKHFPPKMLLKYVLEYPIRSLVVDICRFLKGDTVLQKVKQKQKCPKKISVFIEAFRMAVLRTVMFYISLLLMITKRVPFGKS